MPSIQSLGLGSDVLKQEQIDQLKAVDEENLLDPIRTDITEAKEKTADLSSLTVSASAAKSAQNPLGEEVSYTKTTVALQGDSIVVNVEDGVSPRDLTLKVTNLATKSIVESNNFSSREQPVSTESGEIKFFVGNRDYSVAIQGTLGSSEELPATTYQDLPSLIIEATNGAITPSILDVGGDTPFKIVLQSKEPGERNQILTGPILRGTKSIIEKELTETLFQSGDLRINEVDILDGTTKAELTSEQIVLSRPQVFSSKDLFINGVDIFDNIAVTTHQGTTPLSVNANIKSDDLRINGVDIFNGSAQPEVQSAVEINELSFPLELETQGIIINGVNVLDELSSTSVVSGVLNNNTVRGVYANNNLVVNGINIFDGDNNAEALSSVAELVGSINSKRNQTNAIASLQAVNDNSFRLVLTSSVPGDNIDIYSNDPLAFSKFRLSQGSTKGQSQQIMLNSTELLATINAKSDLHNVTASIRDNKLTLASNNANNIALSSLHENTLSKIGLKAGTYTEPLGFHIASLQDAVTFINNKVEDTSVVASLNDEGILFTSQTLGNFLTISGNADILTQLGLEAISVEPLKERTLTTIEDLVDSINTHKEESQVEASKVGERVVLKATEDKVNIEVTGSKDKLSTVGLKDDLAQFQDGVIITSANDLASRINELTFDTGVKALARDSRVVLYSPKNGDIILSGDDAKLDNVGLGAALSVTNADEIASTSLATTLGFHLADNQIQEASNAKFLYNNVELTRETNSVNDLVVGVNITLRKVDTEDTSSQVSIAIDKEAIKLSVQEFITSYNSFLRKIDELTAFEYDETKGLDQSTTGSLQGVPTVTNIPYKFSNILTSVDSSLENVRSLTDLGVTFTDQANTLDVNESELSVAIDSHFEEVQKLLLGYKRTNSFGVEVEVEGIFKKLNAEFNGLTQGDNSTFKILENEVSSDIARLETSLTKNQAFLDEKYEQMRQEFIANDLAISKINKNFDALKQQIDIETASK